MNDILLKILTYLPERVRTSILSDTELCENLCEIRLRAQALATVTLYGENRILTYLERPIILSQRELDETLANLCEGSLYSYAESLAQGYVTRFGCRIGVSGKTFCEDGQNGAFSKFFSLNIRIPRFIPNAADRLLAHICKNGFSGGGILVASAPGGGKTTLLKSLAFHLSSGVEYLGKRRFFRVLLADSREELFCDAFRERCTVDVLSGFEKAKSIEMGIRTLCPEIIIADEIGSASDAQSIMNAYLYGCVLIASCHASTLAEIYKREYLSTLIEKGIFGSVYLIRKNGKEFDGELILQNGGGGK